MGCRRAVNTDRRKGCGRGRSARRARARRRPAHGGPRAHPVKRLARARRPAGRVNDADSGSAGGGTVMSGTSALRGTFAVVVGLLLLAATPAYSWHGSGTTNALAIDPHAPS